MLSQTYGQFQEKLVRHTMEQLEKEYTISPLVFFPLIHDRVETFLLAHWKIAWQQCAHMNWDEWLQSECYELYENEVLNDMMNEALTITIHANEFLHESVTEKR